MITAVMFHKYGSLEMFYLSIVCSFVRSIHNSFYRVCMHTTCNCISDLVGTFLTSCFVLQNNFECIVLKVLKSAYMNNVILV